MMDAIQWLDVFRGIGNRMLGEAGDFLSRRGGTIAIGRGAGGDMTFPVDKWAEDIVIDALEAVHRKGASFSLVSEETGIRRFGKGRTTVLVDPIDGSNNAKNGVPFFSTSLALLEGDRLADRALGYVMNLAGGDEFWAIRGGGAYKNGELIKTPDTDSITVVAFEASRPADDLPRILPLLKAARRTRCFGSTALDLAYLAAGAISVFATATSSRAFDYAAGMLLVEEAGGVVTSLDGGTLDEVPAGLERTAPLLASKNAKTHAGAISLLSGRGA